MRKVLLFLGELEDTDVDWFIRCGEKLEIPKGSALIEEKAELAAIYILIQGQLSVSIRGKDEEIARLHVGEIVGELSFLDTRPPSATVTAYTDSIVIKIPREQLELKLAGESDFAARFYRAIGVMMAARLRRADERLGCIRENRPFPVSGYEDDEDFSEDDDELDLERLDTMSLAGARFEFILNKLSGN